MVKNCALIIVLLLAMFYVDTTSALADPCDSITPACTLGMFIESVKNGDGGELRGVVIPGLFASPVVQQPEGQPGYVSKVSGDITQHHIADLNGVIGLLAHNEFYNEVFLGELFHQLKRGDIVILIMGDGRVRLYRVEDKIYYQKLTPNNNWSKYIKLGTDEELSTQQLFRKHYQSEEKYSLLVFQTCIKGFDIRNWGLVFITAKPVIHHYYISNYNH